MAELVSIEVDKEEPWLNAIVKIDNSKKLSYRFGVDDTCKLLFNSKYSEKASKNVVKLINHSIQAKRYFDIRSNGKSGFSIQKNIALFKENKIIKRIHISDLSQSHIGKIGVFIKKIGYIPFGDKMNTTQVSRWHEYPKVGFVEGDTAASLIESDFSRLKETADVIIGNNISKVKIYNKIIIPEFTLNKSLDGSILIDAKFNSKSENTSDSSTSGTLLEILRARTEGKQYLETDKGFVKITPELDWLQNKIQNDGQLKLSTLEFVRFHEQFGSESKVKGKAAVIEKIRTGLISRDRLELPLLKKRN